MSILKEHNNMPEGLMEELALYGITREEAKGKVSSSRENPEYFGIKRDSEDYELRFGEDLERLVEDNFSLAIIAPEEGEFDMLAPKKVGETLSLKKPSDIRQFLRNLVDKV